MEDQTSSPPSSTPPTPPSSPDPVVPETPAYVVMNVYPPQQTFDSATNTVKVGKTKVGVQLWDPGADGKLKPSGQGYEYFETDDASKFPPGTRLSKAEYIAARIG